MSEEIKKRLKEYQQKKNKKKNYDTKNSNNKVLIFL